MKNEEFRMKKTSEARLSVAQATTPKGRGGLRMQTRVNWGCFGIALQPSTLTGEPECFMTYHKTIDNACGCVGGFAANFFILHS